MYRMSNKINKRMKLQNIIRDVLLTISKKISRKKQEDVEELREMLRQYMTEENVDIYLEKCQQG